MDPSQWCNSRITIEGLYFKPKPVGQTIDLGLDYSLPPRQAIQLLQRTLRTNRKVLRHPPPKVWVKEFADSAITYRLMTWQTSALELQQLKSDLLEQIWYSLQRIHQSIPYPIRDIRTKPSQARLPSNNVTQFEKEQLLAASEIFGHLSRDQLTTLANAARSQCFAPGETVVCQGDHGDSLYVIASGNLDVFKTSGSKSALSWPGQQVASLHKTSIFGEMALCTGENRQPA